jgi:hypothetical protein
MGTGASVWRNNRTAYKEVPRLYADWKSGEAVSGAGKELRLGERAPLSAVLEGLPPLPLLHVFFCGEAPGGAGRFSDWIGERKVWGEWQDAGSRRQEARFVVRLRHRETGRRVILYRAANWFGADVSPHAAREQLALLTELLAGEFPGARVFPTPGRTFCDLFEKIRGNAPNPRHYTVAPEEIRALIHATSTQGRVQRDLLVPPGAELPDELPGLYIYDSRFDYAAYAYHMPVLPVGGEPIRDERPDFEPDRPGRYRVRFRVPEGWEHLGLVPVKRAGRNADSGALEWEYPDRAGSGPYETWLDTVEVAMLARHGWPFDILERVLFWHPGRDGAPPEPLTALANKLKKLRERVELAGERGELDGAAAGWLKGALRDTYLQGIGTFHRVHWEEEFFITRDDLRAGVVPREWRHTITMQGGIGTYRKRVPLSGAALKYCHPEISAAVYARSRARALYSEGYGQGPTGALSRPRTDLYSIYADELQFVRDPGFTDSGRVGALRLKGLLPGPVARPKSAAEYAEMREAAEAHLAKIGGGDGAVERSVNGA